MRLLALAALVLLGCASSEPGPERALPAASRAAPIRDYADIQASLTLEVFEVISADGAPFRLVRFLEANQARAGNSGLAELLSHYALVDGTYSVREAVATPLSMFLWTLLFERMGGALAATCHAPRSAQDGFDLKPQTKDVLRKLCAWPDREAKEALPRLWELLVGHRAPDGERIAWVQYFETDYAGEAPERVVADAVFTALMNPYHLLAR